MFMHGVTDVVLREHFSGDVIYQQTVRFDDRNARVHVVDDDGAPAVVDKWGRLGRAFEGGAAANAGQLVGAVSDLLRDLNDRVGVPSFVAYGTLLGAVRTGHLIGHDFDTDVAYLSRHSHPADLALESFSIRRYLADLGWNCRRTPNGVIQVWATDDRGVVGHIDIFAAYFYGDAFSLDRWVEGPLRREQVVPLGEVELEGHRLPAPADPRSLLALTYGPSWEVPDPAFKFERSQSHARRVQGWTGNQVVGRGKWSRWYQAQARRQQPSDFSRWVGGRLEPGTLVVDIGCGRGVDTMWLADRTGRAVGIDYATQAVDAAREHAQRHSTASFVVFSIMDLRIALAKTASLAAEGSAKALYARLTLDALSDGGRHNLWSMARTLLLGGGGYAFLEFRDEPGDPFEASDTPWGRVLDPQIVRNEIAARGGTVEEEHVVVSPSNSRARPALRRVVARW